MRQLTRLGIVPSDVRHIVLTHLHFDHTGSLPGFPHAMVHVHRREFDAYLHPRSWIEPAYDRTDDAHGPHWMFYDRVGAEWLGLEAIRLPFRPEIYPLSLFGYMRGHCGVAIRDGEGWPLHCADALPLNVECDVTLAWLNRMVLGPHGPRLQAFAQDRPEVRRLAGHMAAGVPSGAAPWRRPSASG